MTQWEYKTIAGPGREDDFTGLNVKADEFLNNMGKNGWELVAALPAIKTNDFHYILKRELKPTLERFTVIKEVIDNTNAPQVDSVRDEYKPL
jgi:hypothetical protein